MSTAVPFFLNDLFRAPAPACLTPDPDAIVDSAEPIRQKRKATMLKWFQEGAVKYIGGVWKGRYWMDVPGEEKRKYPRVALGTKSEMTRSEARRKLADVIDKFGLNKSNYVEKLEGRAKPFNDVADAWELKRLPHLALSTQN